MVKTIDDDVYVLRLRSNDEVIYERDHIWVNETPSGAHCSVHSKERCISSDIGSSPEMLNRTPRLRIAPLDRCQAFGERNR